MCQYCAYPFCLLPASIWSEADSRELVGLIPPPSPPKSRGLKRNTNNSRRKKVIKSIKNNQYIMYTYNSALSQLSWPTNEAVRWCYAVDIYHRSPVSIYSWEWCWFARSWGISKAQQATRCPEERSNQAQLKSPVWVYHQVTWNLTLPHLLLSL